VSTSPTKVYKRLQEAVSPKTVIATENSKPIYDLVYDPSSLAIHTTIPAIPEPGTAAAEGLSPSETPWTRIEALSVHSQILSTYSSTRRHLSELERTCKTSRGWWVVWMRLPSAAATPTQSNINDARNYREAFLIRKASDYMAPSGKKISLGSGRDSTNSSTWSAGKLAEGIGIDPRRYIENLLSLSR
jgi:hypothetical protein